MSGLNFLFLGRTAAQLEYHRLLIEEISKYSAVKVLYKDPCPRGNEFNESVAFDTYRGESKLFDLLRSLQDYFWYSVNRHNISFYQDRQLKYFRCGPFLRFVFKAAARSERVSRLIFRLSRVSMKLAGLGAAMAYRKRLQGVDAILVQPGNMRHTPDLPLIAAAWWLRIPIYFLQYSWDSMTNKGCLPPFVTRFFAFNVTNRDYAVKLHHVPQDKNRSLGIAVLRPVLPHDF